MNINRIHPEIRSLTKFIPTLPVSHKAGLNVIRLLSKWLIKEKIYSDVSIEEIKLRHITVRIYRPENSLSGAGMLWIHGGGLIMGFAAMNDKECSSYAKELKLVVVSVEYRLAPEHKFPAAIDDCYDAWNWFQSEAENLGVDPERIAISGQSAGGGLAANLVHRIHDNGGVQPAAQVLIYPMLDDRTAKHRNLDSINHLIWNNKNNRAAWSWYLGHPVGMPSTLRYAVPARRENLTELPATWIGVGELDLFYEENCLYAERLKKDRVNCHLNIVPMAPHAFDVLVPNSTISEHFNNDIYRFLHLSLEL